MQEPAFLLRFSWRLSNVIIPAGHTITGATLTITSIRNWDTNANTLFIHLLNTAQNYSTGFTSANPGGVGSYSATTNGVTSFIDVNPAQSPVTTISDAFGADYATNPLVSGANTVSNNILLAANTYSTIAVTTTINFTAAQLASLASFIAAGNDFAFGFDSDCHFWNNGITFQITTTPNPTPEPATMVLLGSGLAGFGYLQRRRRQRARTVTASTI